ncbi:MAG: winged helix-turn-helix domain-containing protein [Candidatus Thorarchaeota archaeon]
MGYLRIHPRAYLSRKANVKKGILSRSKILFAIEKGNKTNRQIESQIKITYSTIHYHLNNMKQEKIVELMSEKRPFRWKLTGYGQQKLNES